MMMMIIAAVFCGLWSLINSSDLIHERITTHCHTLISELTIK